ncbi:ankyrin repeat protein, putative [Bodo saltans]|uniref:Ankyrin repeat protein, putative n=1 Tax=Bodo saltans TaxID=75058 RepID=A0A0S4JKK3_BODSA|nr:ankyrin repeat protein, putative [Bodo saltans]|eukprot:CUG89927.1 ankyrin repeat protein, putative [Bodo saltans]
MHHPAPSNSKPKMLPKRLGQPTPLDAPVLCLIRTANATGTNLVATLHTTLETSLSDLRIKLHGIAAAARTRMPLESSADQNIPQATYLHSTPQVSKGTPVNYTSASDLDKVMTARLHAFDLTAPFRFVRLGGARTIPRAREAKLRLVDVLPIIHPAGLPQDPLWQCSPPYGTVVVKPKVDDSPVREAIVALFVAQGEFIDDMHSEKIIMERLLLQQQSYGRQTNVKQLSTVVHKWNANAKDFLGRTPLHEYSFEGNYAAVKYLVSLPFVRIEERDQQGNTALHLAAQSGHIDCATALLDNGAHILIMNHIKQTPLHIALYKRNDTLVDLLCRRLKQQGIPLKDLAPLTDLSGANPMKIFKDLAPPIEELILNGNVEELRAMTRHYLFGSVTKLVQPRRCFNNDTLLHVAAQSGREEMVKFLIDEVRWLSLVPSSAHDAFLDGSKRSPLHLAASKGHTNIVRRLIPVMAQLSATTDVTGCTPLMLALQHGNVLTAQFIVENFEDVGVNCVSRRGLTALHFAAMVGAVDVATRLISQFGAQVDAHHTSTVVAKRKMMTSSSRPTGDDRQELLRFLRLVRSKYSRGTSRRRLAPLPMYERTTRVLHGPTPLWCALASLPKEGPAVASLLLVHGAGSTFIDDSYLTHLLKFSLASKQWDISGALVRLMGTTAPTEGAILAFVCAEIPRFGSDCVRWLIDRKVGTDSVFNALKQVTKIGDIKTVKYLLDNGATLSNQSACELLATAVLHRHAACVEEYVRRGAPLTNVDEEKSPLLIAAKLGFETAVRGFAFAPSVSTFDAVNALVVLLRTATSTRAQIRRSNASAPLIDSWNAMGCSLLKRVLLTDAHVHPVELLHLSCAAGLFKVADLLVEKLAALPTDARVAIIRSTPSAALRPSVTITPKPLPGKKKSTSDSAKKRKPLYKPQLSFERFLYTAPSATTLEHRRVFRDAFSYLAQHGMRDLIESLIVDIRLSPWRNGDLRGWNAVDYALECGHYDTVVALVGSGVIPLRRHVSTASSKCGLFCAAASEAYARLKRSGDISSAATSLRTLLEVIAELGFVEVLNDILKQLCVTLRQSNLQQLPWVLAVVRAAVQHHQIGVLKLLVQQFVPDLGSPLSDGGEELLLSAVVSNAPQSMIHLLLCHRVPVHVPSPLSKSTQRLLKSKLRDGADGKTKLIAAAAAATLFAHDTLSKILVAAGAPTAVSADVSQDLVTMSVYSTKCDLTGANENTLFATLENLFALGCALPPLSTMKLAAEKGFTRVTRLLLVNVGIVDKLREDFEQCEEGVEESILYQLMVHGGTAADEILPHAIATVEPSQSNETDADDGATEPAGLAKLIEALKLACAKNPKSASTMLQRALLNGCIHTSIFLAMLGVGLTKMPSFLAWENRSSMPEGGGSLSKALARVLISASSSKREDAERSSDPRELLRVAAKVNNVQLVRLLLQANRVVDVVSEPLDVLVESAVSGAAQATLALGLREAEELSLSIAPSSTALVQAIICDTLSGRHAKGLSYSLLLGNIRRTSSSHVPVSLWKALSDSHQPLLSAVLRSRTLRRCLIVQQLAFTRITPITLAAALGDEQLLLDLVRAGASVTCQLSEMGLIGTSLGVQQNSCALFSSSGSKKWRQSNVDDGLRLEKAVAPSCPPLLSAVIDNSTIIEAQCRVSPIIVATRLFAMAHFSKRTSLVSRYISLLRTLIRRGALTRDVLHVVAIVVTRFQCWDLVTDVIEEGVRLSSVHESTDRFFQVLKLDDVPLLLRPIVGTSRHVLHTACRYATRDIIILLARHCVRQDVEGCRDGVGRTPLYYSLLNPSNIEALETLVALQVPATTLCDYTTRRTPLMIASRAGNAAAVANLLKFGHVDATDAYGNTALMFGATSGKQDVVELLLSGQADATTTNNRGLTATMLAAAAGLDHIALPMAQHFSRLASFLTSTTSLLHCAAMGGCQRVVDYILRTYDSLGIFQEDSCGLTPVYLAYAFGRGAILRQMLSELQHRTESAALALDEKLLNCDSRLHRYGWLSQAMTMGEALAQETKKRAKFSLAPFELICAPQSDRLRHRRSRLLWCAENRNVVGVRVLADLNVCDDCFAIHGAARRGSVDVIQLLIALRMSDPNQRDRRGFLPIEHAILAGHKETASFLMQQMRITVDTIHDSIHQSGTSVLHMIAMSGSHSLLGALVPMLLQQGAPADPKTSIRAATDSLAAEATLSALLAEDVEGRTPFEVAVLFGSAATTLRIAQAIQQVSALAVKDVTITIPSSLFELKPCISPSVRAALYDFFDVEEVFTQSIFAETFNGTRKRRYATGGDAGDRLLFGDIRMIGVATMKTDPFCASKLEQVYTVDRERQVLKQLISAMYLPFRLKFRPEGLKGLTSPEQVDVLQRLCTSTLLGKYLSLPPKLHPVGTLELESVQKRSEVGVALQGTTVVERFMCTKNAMHSIDLHSAIVDFHFIECRKELARTQTLLQEIVKSLRELSHPLLKSLVLRIDWNGLRLEGGVSNNNKSTGDEGAIVDPTESKNQLAIAVSSVRYLNNELLPELRLSLCGGAIHDLLLNVSAAELSTVDCTLDKYHSVTLRCYESLLDIPNAAKTDLVTTQGDAASVPPLFEGRDIVIPFIASSGLPFGASKKASQLHNAALVGLVRRATDPIEQIVKKDVVLLGVQRLRDSFIQTVHELLMSSAASAPSSPLRFKLEIEGVEMDELPLELLQQLLSDTIEALRTILGVRSSGSISDAKSKQKKYNGPSSWKYLTSAHLVAQSVANGVNAVTVLFSNRRAHIVRRNASRLMLCFTPTVAPCRHEIEQCIRADTIEMELEKLKELIPQTVHDMSQRLNTYLPTTSLVVDLPSLTDLPSDDDVLAALALLNHDRSAVILQELIRGISVGWDTKLGSLVRRHVRTLTVTLQRSGSNATVSLLQNGNLVIHYPLQCVEYARGRPHNISTWAVPSSQQIASLLLLQLSSLHPEVKTLVDLTKGYACWCNVTGAHTRRVIAGDVRCGFTITVRNVLNLPPKDSLEETFEFVSDKSLSSLRVKRQPVTTATKAKCVTVYYVKFSAPTEGPFLNLAVKLHGQHVLNSPLRIRVRPSSCSPSQTICTSAFNCVVAKEKSRLTFQLRDQFGSAVLATPSNLQVDGPSINNPDRVMLASWASKVPGVVSVLFSVEKEGAEIPVPIRFQVGGESHVVVKTVEVVSPDIYKAIIDIKKGSIEEANKNPNDDHSKKGQSKAKLYFRAAVRSSERAKKQRACRRVGGVKHRKFPPSSDK